MQKTTSVGRLFFLFALIAGCLNADTSFTIPANSTDSGGAISGAVDFFLTDCDTACVLNIEFSGAEANPTSAAQLISGVTFDLTDSGVDLTEGKAKVETTISNGSGGAVDVIDSKGKTTTTTATPARWEFETTSGDFELTTLTGTKPNYLIIGAGPYTKMNSSITQHSPSLEGPVDFMIAGLTGLNSSTEVSNVAILMGTNPDAIVTQLTCSGNCGNPIVNQGGSGPSAPEPFSFLLAGSALGTLAFVRRRHPRRHPTEANS